MSDLIEKYPELFPDGKCLCGISIGDGWKPIVDKLCGDIVTLCKTQNFQFPVVVQIKEKFGGLRFYVDGETDEIEDLIDEAEEQCGKTCERCGAPGISRNRSWILTLCDECHLSERSELW